MRRLAWVFFLIAAHAGFAQTFVRYVASAPTGGCLPTPPLQVVASTGVAYTCNNGTWAAVAGSGGAPSGSAGGSLSGTYPNPGLATSISTTNITATGALTDGALTPGNCVQASTGGLLATTGASCGGSGGPPTGSAGGSLSGTYPNPGLATSISTTNITATSSLTDSALTSGNCVQASTGGLLTTIGSPCGAGSGVTLQTNTVSNTSQVLLNFTTTSTVAFSNPSGGVESAAIVSPGANTVLGFNGSNAYTGFTAGTGISLAGGQITNTSTGTISGTLASGNIPVGTGTSTLGVSQLSDNATTLTYAGTGGISAAGGVAGTGTTPGAFSFTAGSGNIPALAANSGGFAAPVAGGTSYLLKLPGTITQGFLFAGTPATGDNVNESAISVGSPEFILSAGTANYGQYASGTLIASAKMTRAGHFENLEIANVSGSCAGGPIINVHDLTAATTGTGLAGPTTGAPGGVFADQAQTLTWAAGDRIAIMVDTVGTAPCTGNFTVNATGATP